MTSKAVSSLERKPGNMKYDHQSYRLRRQICRFLLRTLAFSMMAKIDQVDGLENIPADGPAILMINHIAFVDPFIMLYVIQRDIVPMAKDEVYRYPVVGIFPRIWGVIPVNREAVDRRAIQRAMDVLRAGEIVLVAPEGTRSPALQEGKEGAAYLASRSGAPIVPAAITDSQGFPTHPFSKRWQGSGVRVRYGAPFKYKEGLQRARGEMLRTMMDEAMFVLSAMLPEEMRGIYHDLSKTTQDTIEWL